MADDVRQQLLQLEGPQAAELLRAALARVDDREAAIDEEAIASRRDEDAAYVRDLAAATAIDVAASRSEPGSAKAVVLALYDNVPDVRPILRDELETAQLPQETLDFGISLIGILVVAAAVAILRPRVEVHKKRHGDESETQVEVEVRGVENVGEVLKTLMPFL